jgi:phage shock protein A
LRTDIVKINTAFEVVEKKQRNLNYAVNELRKDALAAEESAKSQREKIDALEARLERETSAAGVATDALKTNLSAVENQTTQDVTTVREGLDTTRLLGLLGALGLILLSGLVFLLLRRQLTGSTRSVEDKLRTTREELTAEGVRLDEKLLGVLETQLKIQEADREYSAAQLSSAPAAVTVTEAAPDHGLALKVADEIIRIRRNIDLMDAKTRGLKQLTASVGRIEDNFAGNGYEIVAMVGKLYKEGLKAVATFIPSEELETNQQIITRIIKPQVNYVGVMIQAAQIEVSVGE